MEEEASKLFFIFREFTESEHLQKGETCANYYWCLVM